MWREDFLKEQSQSENRLQLWAQVKMPEIPRAFLQHPKIKYVLIHTINDFSYEEKNAIYAYCIAEKSISEIADFTELTHNHVLSTLNLYSEKLSALLVFLQKTIPYDTKELVSVGQLLGAQF